MPRQTPQLRSSRSKKARLDFPVGRIHRHLREGKYMDRVAKGTPVYLAAVLEHLATTVLNKAYVEMIKGRKTGITPRLIQLAIKNDSDLEKVFTNATISNGGVTPHIHPLLLPKKITKK